jgi:hypothetical protein
MAEEAKIARFCNGWGKRSGESPAKVHGLTCDIQEWITRV